jgi:hypothetical protein
MTDTEKLDALVLDVANDLRGTVKDIENSIKTTQNHYGRYMSLIGQLAKGDKTTGNFIALALIEAGANRQGVTAALRVSF